MSNPNNCLRYCDWADHIRIDDAIALMAHLLAKAASRYQVGKRPNASAISEAVIQAAEELVPSDTRGLLSAATRLNQNPESPRPASADAGCRTTSPTAAHQPARADYDHSRGFRRQTTDTGYRDLRGRGRNHQ